MDPSLIDELEVIEVDANLLLPPLDDNDKERLNKANWLSHQEQEWQEFVQRRNEEGRCKQEQQQCQMEEAGCRREEEKQKWSKPVQHEWGETDAWMAASKIMKSTNEDQQPLHEKEQHDADDTLPETDQQQEERMKQFRDEMAQRQRERRQRWEQKAEEQVARPSLQDHLEDFCQRMMAGSYDRKEAEQKKQTLKEKREFEVRESGITMLYVPDALKQEESDVGSDEEGGQALRLENMLAIIDREEEEDKEFEAVKHLLPDLQNQGQLVLATSNQSARLTGQVLDEAEPEVITNNFQTKQLEMIEQGIEAAIVKEMDGAEEMERLQVERLQAERASMEETRVRFEKRRAREQTNKSFALPPKNAKIIPPGSFGSSGATSSSSSGVNRSMPLPNLVGHRKRGQSQKVPTEMPPELPLHLQTGNVRDLFAAAASSHTLDGNNNDFSNCENEVELSEETQRLQDERELQQRAKSQQERLQRMKERRLKREQEKLWQQHQEELGMG